MTKKRIFLIVSVLTLVVAGIFIALELSKKPEFDLEQMHLHLDDESYQRLSDLRESALEIGHIERTDDEWVPASVNYRGETISGETRLKGDWLDHLNENKWSFRIKLESAFEDGLQVYSVQNPQVRDFLNGYVFHQIMREEGILTNEYRFIELLVNDESWGIYCLEEHLTDRLFTNQGRTKGVILKFKDDVYFEAASDSSETDGLIKDAEVKVYGDAKKDDVFKKQVKKAKKIIEKYQHQEEDMYEHFDPELMGKYYALCDLATAYHAMGWINIRFFYNFETEMMEPLAYDPYPILEWGKPTLGHNAQHVQLDPFSTEMIVYSAMKDSAIYNAYLPVLDRVSEAGYVNKFMNKHLKDLKFYESQIQLEYKDYSYDYDFIKDRAEEIRNFRQKNK